MKKTYRSINYCEFLQCAHSRKENSSNNEHALKYVGFYNGQLPSEYGIENDQACCN